MTKVDKGPNTTMRNTTLKFGNTSLNSFNDRESMNQSNNMSMMSNTRLGPSKSLAVLEMIKNSQLPSLTDTIKPRA